MNACNMYVTGNLNLKFLNYASKVITIFKKEIIFKLYKLSSASVSRAQKVSTINK